MWLEKGTPGTEQGPVLGVHTSPSGRWDMTLPRSSQTTGGMSCSTGLQPAWLWKPGRYGELIDGRVDVEVWDVWGAGHTTSPTHWYLPTGWSTAKASL